MVCPLLPHPTHIHPALPPAARLPPRCAGLPGPDPAAADGAGSVCYKTWLSCCASQTVLPAALAFAQDFPGLIRPLLVERDQYMAFMLRKLSSRAHTVVAVVGAGHLQGIR